MPRKAVHSISIPVSHVRLETGDRAHALATFHCRNCKFELAILQPNTRNPDRLLGTCHSCGGWSLIECHPDESSASIATLPSLGVTRAGAAKSYPPIASVIIPYPVLSPRRARAIAIADRSPGR
jgi:hypothetical protein